MIPIWGIGKNWKIPFIMQLKRSSLSCCWIFSYDISWNLFGKKIFLPRVEICVKSPCLGISYFHTNQITTSFIICVTYLITLYISLHWYRYILTHVLILFSLTLREYPIFCKLKFVKSLLLYSEITYQILMTC